MVFAQPQRKQGGGKRTIFCSAKCRSKDWARGNRASRTATILKYEAKPVVAALKRAKSLLERFKKYGLTALQFEALLARQHSKCATCHTYVDKVTGRIDHDHSTGQVRGILCDSCNWALGHAKDDRARLYQMAAYLELDRSKPVVYIIGSLQNDGIPLLGDMLRDHGYEAVDNWYAAGKEADKSWQEYSTKRGKTYAEALSSREANHTFFFDRSYINLSDAVVMLYPAGRSAHLEFGYAIGQGKRGYILMEDSPERYDVMAQFASATVFLSQENLLRALENEVKHATFSPSAVSVVAV
jgi:hypothetical protein